MRAQQEKERAQKEAAAQREVEKQEKAAKTTAQSPLDKITAPMDSLRDVLDEHDIVKIPENVVQPLRRLLADLMQMEKDCDAVLDGDITKLPTTPISEVKKMANDIKKAEAMVKTLLKAVRCC